MGHCEEQRDEAIFAATTPAVIIQLDWVISLLVIARLDRAIQYKID